MIIKGVPCEEMGLALYAQSKNTLVTVRSAALLKAGDKARRCLEPTKLSVRE